MAVKASSYKLNISCVVHPDYRGIRRSKCPACQLIFVLKHQHSNPDVLGGLNPYQFLGIRKACEDLKVEAELTPSRLEFTTKAEKERHEDFHYIGCPQYNKKSDEITGSCVCAQLSRE